MKNGCNEILEAKIAERNERAKKLYRYVSDVARRVGDMTTASTSIADLFSTNIEVQRQKLRDNCEKLLFLDPLNYGKKTLELLWRKVYYDTVSTAKKLRETDSNNDCYLYTHIECGIGNFHHFIARINIEMKVEFKDLDYMPLLDEEIQEVNETPADDTLHFGQSALHSCLIYLGDLSRYQVEIFQNLDPSIVARYYLQAAHIDMSSGMPYNQLGNLYLDKNYNLDSVCYYIQCLNCTTPFEGAMDNLTKIFEKNGQFGNSFNDSETLSQPEHIQNAIVNFLSLIEIWYFSKNDTNIPQRCNTIAHELKTCMDFTKSPLPDINKNYTEYTQVLDDENTTPTYLNSNLVHKIVQICLFTVAKMVETDETKAFACKAFTLALLSQLLQKLLKHLESLGFENPGCKYYPKMLTSHDAGVEKVEQVDKSNVITVMENHITNGIKDSQDEGGIKESEFDEGTEKIPNGDTKNNIKKTLSKRRRRRRVASSESSDMSDVDTENSDIETYESCSAEELSDSSYQSEGDNQSEGSDDDGSVTEDITNKNSQDNESETTKKAQKEKDSELTEKDNAVNGDTIVTGGDNLLNKSITQDNELKVMELQNFLQGDNFLASIKLLLDWVMLEKDLILSCGDSGESLFQCIVDLLNIFTFYFTPKNNETAENECPILKYAKSVAKKLKLEYKTIPLPEDINLRGTNICKFDKDAAEWQILEKYKLSVYEENVIRILNFIDFGNQIAKIVPRVRFNRSMKIFYFKKNPHLKLDAKLNHKKGKEWHNSKKHVESSEGGLLRRLGRLWLASQVRELERSGQAATPALLALDSAALNKHLRRVKQLLRARSFVLLVPTVVLQELDNLKREQSTARDAIRWLEVQLKSGSRFLRAQRPGQSKPLPLLKYPRKAPPHVHNFIQILEFCNHFIADDKHMLGGNGDPDNTLQAKPAPMLILLVGNEPGNDEEQYKEFSVTGAAQSAGITVEHIADYYTKWRQTVHKTGKKR